MQRARLTAVIAGAAALAVALTACGSKSSTTGTGTTPTTGTSGAGGGSTAPATSAFKACMVTDTGGINDKSFNQSAWAGMQAAQADGKATGQLPAVDHRQ